LALLSFGICGREEKKTERVEKSCFNFIMEIVLDLREIRKDRKLRTIVLI
jgi:hypothetical protein